MPRPSPRLLLPLLLVAIHRLAGVSSRRPHASFASPTVTAPQRRQRGGPVRRRRIRPASRAAAAATSSRSEGEEASAADPASATAEGAESPSHSSDSSCPFSMAFPRYRVDLTGGRRDDGDVGGVGNVPFLSVVRASLDRSKAEGLYRSDVRGGTFRWIDVSGRSGDCPGAHVAAAFWEAVADVADGCDGGGGRRLVLALPGTSVLTLRRLADVSNWLEERTGGGGAAGVGSGRSVRASVDDASPVPTVVVAASSPLAEGISGAPSPAFAEPSPRSESETAKIVEARTKSWVRRILVDLGVCPFTKSDTRSGQGLSDLGVPVARIAYHHSAAGLGQLPRLMADTWKAISEMISSGPGGKDGISSILLSAPAFDDDFPLWAGPVFAALESTVTAAAAEPRIGVVCFHPRYATPDGSSWPGFGHMHSVPRLRKWLEERDPDCSGELSDEEVAAGGAWQRRTPHACVNVLRAEQLAAAEGRRSTGDLYAANIRALVGHEGGVGSTKLSSDLEEERRMER